jgi:hypothetical protein
MKWTVVEIILLLSVNAATEGINTKSSAEMAAIDVLLKADLIKRVPTNTLTTTPLYNTTDKGNKMIEMICNTPLPKQNWVDPREEKK